MRARREGGSGEREIPGILPGAENPLLISRRVYHEQKKYEPSDRSDTHFFLSTNKNCMIGETGRNTRNTKNA